MKRWPWPRWVPESAHRRHRMGLFDHFIRERDQHRRHLQPHCFGSLGVDDERVARWLLERQISWPRTLEDAGNHIASALERFLQIRPVGHQAAVADHEIVFVDRRYLSLGG